MDCLQTHVKTEIMKILENSTTNIIDFDKIEISVIRITNLLMDQHVYLEYCPDAKQLSLFLLDEESRKTLQNFKKNQLSNNKE